MPFCPVSPSTCPWTCDVGSAGKGTISVTPSCTGACSCEKLLTQPWLLNSRNIPFCKMGRERQHPNETTSLSAPRLFFSGMFALMSDHSVDFALEKNQLQRVFILFAFISEATPWSRRTWAVLNFNLYIYNGRNICIVLHRIGQGIQTSPT